jgi:hypothetical protein
MRMGHLEIRVMEPTHNGEPVLLTASGASTRVAFPRVDIETDRLRVAWCLIGAGAATASGSNRIKHLNAYFTKTISTLVNRVDNDEMREIASRWGQTVIYKHRNQISPLAVVALLVGGKTTDEFGDLVPAYDGMIDPGLQQTARILFGHPVSHCGVDQCGVCRAIATDDWHIAFKLATLDDYEIALGALIELYLGGLADGLTAQATTPRAVRPAIGFSTAAGTLVAKLPRTPGMIRREDVPPHEFVDRRGWPMMGNVAAKDQLYVYLNDGTKQTHKEYEDENF